MRLLDMSSTACVSGLTDSHRGKSINNKLDPKKMYEIYLKKKK